jgi:Secretion system C-terminal sorting domain
MVTTTYSITGTNAAGCSATTLLTLNVGECTGITKLTANSNAFEVFPNPTNSEITIKTFNSETKSFELTDLSGRVVFSGKGSDDSAQINMRSFANGVYYLKIQSATSTDVIKIIKN